MKPRLIPILLIQNGGLVKGEQFKNHAYVGDPVNAVKIFNEKEVDEIAIIDISCTKEKREPNYGFINEITSEAFMPLAYGGGLYNINQVSKILQSGVEKVIFNTAAYTDPKVIEQTAKEFGSSSTVISIDVKKTLFSGKKVYVKNGTQNIKIDPITYAKQMESLGAGEIILTSIDMEGSMTGYDLELLEQVSSKVSIPVIINGGGGSLDHFKVALSSGASALGAGSFFVFQGKHRAVLITYPDYETIEKLIQ